MAKESSIRRVNGADLYTETAGAGIPVVLIHAGIADCRMWEPQWNTFAARHRLLRYDLRGFGRSSIPPAPFTHHADLSALLDDLEIDSAVLVGASFGGEVALAFALEHPERVRGLALVGTLAGKGPATSDVLRNGWDAMEVAFERGDLDAAVEIELGMWVDGPHRQPADVDRSVREFVREMDAALLRRADEQEAATEIDLDPPVRDRLGEIAAPTLVIVGLLDMPDALISADTLVTTIPGATRHDVPDAAHLPTLEAPAALNRLLLDWMASLPVGR